MRPQILIEEQSNEPRIALLVMAEEGIQGDYSHDESIIAAVNLKSDDSNQLRQSDRDACSSSSAKNTNTAEANGNGIGSKSKSCKGCLYYSSRFKSDSRNPLCVGLSRSLPNVPQQIVGPYEAEASKEKEDRNLREFRYACVGYSLYEDRKGQALHGQQSQKELPFCVGLEVLVDRRVKTADSAPTPADRGHNKGDGNGLPHRKSPKPMNATGEEFLTRVGEIHSLNLERNTLPSWQHSENDGLVALLALLLLSSYHIITSQQRH